VRHYTSIYFVHTEARESCDDSVQNDYRNSSQNRRSKKVKLFSVEGIDNLVEGPVFLIQVASKVADEARNHGTGKPRKNGSGQNIEESEVHALMKLFLAPDKKMSHKNDGEG